MKKKAQAKPAGERAAAKPREKKSAATVDDFMAGLTHPLKGEIATVRRIILAADASIAEAIKWNAPSFCTTEFFATCNLRAQDRVQLIFHLGAKVRADLPKLEIPDPAGLMKWLAKDRCLVTLGAGKEVAKNGPALQALVRAWIKFV